MPNYQQPLGRLGGAAGAGAGGILGSLGSLLEPLSYPQQALYNAGQGLYRAATGEGTWEDALGAVPGALGALGTAGAAMIPGVGLPLAMGLGAGLAGISQGIGKMTGSEAFEAPTVEDFAGEIGLDPENQVSNFLLSSLTDPLTFAGGVGGGVKGAAAGAKYGKRLENIAQTMGPQFEHAAGFEQWLPHVPANKRHMPYTDRFTALMESPDAARVLQEIPTGSEYLSQGAEAFTFKTPQGGVVRVAGGPYAMDTLRDWEMGLEGAPPPRLNEASTLVPAVRSVPIGDYRVEHLPTVNPTPSFRTQEELQALASNPVEHARYQFLESVVPHLEAKTRSEGFTPQDVVGRNMGTTPAGNAILLDAGTVTGKQAPELFTPTTGNRLENAILKAMGAPQGVRRDIESGLQTALTGRGISPEEMQLMERLIEEQMYGSPMSQISTGLPLSQRQTGPLGAPNASLNPPFIRIT